MPPMDILPIDFISPFCGGSRFSCPGAPWTTNIPVKTTAVNNHARSGFIDPPLCLLQNWFPFRLLAAAQQNLQIAPHAGHSFGIRRYIVASNMRLSVDENKPRTMCICRARRRFLLVRNFNSAQVKTLLGELVNTFL